MGSHGESIRFMLLPRKVPKFWMQRTSRQTKLDPGGTAVDIKQRIGSTANPA